MVNSERYLTRIKNDVHRSYKSGQDMGLRKRALEEKFTRDFEGLNNKFKRSSLGNGLYKAIPQIQNNEWFSKYEQLRDNLPSYLNRRLRNLFRKHLSSQELLFIWEYLLVRRNPLFAKQRGLKSSVGKLYEFIVSKEIVFVDNTIKTSEGIIQRLKVHLHRFDNPGLIEEFIGFLEGILPYIGRLNEVLRNQVNALREVNYREFMGFYEEQEGELDELNKVILGFVLKKGDISRTDFVKYGLAAGVAIGFFGISTLISCAGRLPRLMTPTTINARELFNAFLHIPELKSMKEPIFSSDVNARTIIIIEDEYHGIPERESMRLRILRTKFNINFIGIEGWAGHEVDKKRGFQILNAEEELIKEIIHDPNYFVIGLEDDKIQVLILKASIWKLNVAYLQIKNSSKDQEGMSIYMEGMVSLFKDLRLEFNQKNLEMIKEELKKYWGKIYENYGEYRVMENECRDLSIVKRNDLLCRLKPTVSISRLNNDA